MFVCGNCDQLIALCRCPRGMRRPVLSRGAGTRFVTGVLLKVGTRSDGLVFTREMLEYALERVRADPKTRSAWIEGDDLKVVTEVPRGR